MISVAAPSMTPSVAPAANSIRRRVRSRLASNFEVLARRRPCKPGQASLKAKSSRAERGQGNTHPTVKPVALMEWLVRLVTPPGGVVLDPFAGSGTTGIAALREGFDFIGIERAADYCDLARQRIRDDSPLINGTAEMGAHR